VTVPSLTHPDAPLSAALRLFSPFAFWSFTDNTVHVTPWRGSPWFFLGWQLALCAIAVLVALLRGADSRIRPRITRALWVALVVAGIMLVLANVVQVAHTVAAR
jgi:drug/metabolite transporter (DMT)-like permease